ncbi:type II toxin-antitoxin system Phd/YefM family antitoxin [Ruania zhangjianzhongii]|uniref:type II toxin-antitoxin system Phd/YefM family antitoxin n=1 Tax=Ruania zhangjianzhongii TaxID=2603206 RepID=UPI00143DB5B1|nr:type II toxin-antitoxin system prevent-host-death family antitoxin [Ruania zhangjianzhongii]
MKTVSQRELRNDSGEVMRQVQQGASFRVTSRGVPIAHLAPIEEDPLQELTLREGTGVMEFPPGSQVPESTEDVLSELRGDR